MERKIIIVEGPDGSGKSTLCAALQGLGFTRLRCVPDVKAMHADRNAQPDLFWWYGERLLEYVQAETNVVVDRCYLSEQIYGPEMRGINRLGLYGVNHLHQLAEQASVRHVFCLPPWPTVLANWQFKRREKWDPVKRTGDYVDAEVKLHRIYQLYRQEYEAMQAIYTPGLCHVYDYTVNITAARLLESIEERANVSNA